MNATYPYLGQMLALLSSIIWAFAVILFRKSGETVHPIALNLFKNLLAIILILPTMAIFHQSLILAVPLNKYLIFLLSGILGMAIADTLFFMSLNKIGASLIAIVTCTYSPFIITLSVIFLKESLAILQIFGAVLIVLAVLLTTRIKHIDHITRRTILLGILWGTLSNAATAVGIILIKPLLSTTPLLWATEIRLIGGFLSLLIVTLFLPMRRQIFMSLSTMKGLGYSIGGTIVGTYLAVIIWLAGMKYTSASIASALNQTSSVFVFLFAALILKEKVTLHRTLTIILAIAGVFLVFLG
jgi:drug/metabolite transporter (DMT)-like permease